MCRWPEVPDRKTCKECTIRLDHRSPYVLDTRELGRRPGSMRKVARTVPAPAGLRTEMIGVPEGTDLELNLRLEAVMEGVLLSGTVSGLAVGECIRCLEEVRLPLDAPIQELFCYPDRVVAGEDEDVRSLEADLIDLLPALVDSVVLALPFQPVCRDDCPGLCVECGALLTDEESHRHEVADPRWSALQGVRTDPAPPGPPAAGAPGQKPDEKKES